MPLATMMSRVSSRARPEGVAHQISILTFCARDQAHSSSSGGGDDDGGCLPASA